MVLPDKIPSQPLPLAERHLRNSNMTLQPGTEAPDFTLNSHDGNAVTLSSYRGRNKIVLAFHPAAFTGG